MTPTARTVAFLDKHGVLCGNVERFVQQAGPFGKRYDLFGFLDAIACYPGQVAGLQITSTSNRMSRVHKIMDTRHDEAIAFSRSGGLIEVWGWSKRKVGNRHLWKPKVCQIRLSPDGKGLILVDDIPAGSFPREAPTHGPRPRRRKQV